jgi:hypothetical protein
LPFTRHQIDKLTAEISAAALSSWLKSEGFTRTGRTRDQLAIKIEALLKRGELSEDKLKEGVCSVEEASGKRVFLLRLPSDTKQIQDCAAFEKHLNAIAKTLSKEPKLAPRAPSKPTLVYITCSSKQVRAKWAETQTRIEVEKASMSFTETEVTRVIVLVADLSTGLVELRFDKPEDQNPHSNSKDQYFAYYKQAASDLLGAALIQFETREALRSLVETEPRVVRIRVSSHRSKTDKAVKFVARTPKGDVRDDAEWHAAYEVGETSRAYDDQAVYWLPAASEGALTREVFTAIDAVTSMARVEADCYEGEINYAVSRIRAHQSKAPTAS